MISHCCSCKIISNGLLGALLYNVIPQNLKTHPHYKFGDDIKKKKKASFLVLWFYCFLSPC